MMEELERYKRALAGARHALGMIERNPQVLADISYLTAVQKEIDDILTPPPEFEEVEECAGWVNIYPDGCSPSGYACGQSRPYATKEDADDHVACDRIGCMELRVKVKRPVRRAVIREYEVAAKVDTHGEVYQGVGKAPFADHPECHGKAGVLIFRTAE